MDWTTKTRHHILPNGVDVKTFLYTMTLRCGNTIQLIGYWRMIFAGMAVSCKLIRHVRYVKSASGERNQLNGNRNMISGKRNVETTLQTLAFIEQWVRRCLRRLRKRRGYIRSKDRREEETIGRVWRWGEEKARIGRGRFMVVSSRLAERLSCYIRQ